MFLSPGYNPFPTQPTDWENHLIFWSNVMSLLPRDENIEIGFREIFPQQEPMCGGSTPIAKGWEARA